MLTRRSLLAAGALAAGASAARADTLTLADLRGSLDATHAGLTPGAPDDQSATLAKALARAEDSGAPLFLPPGRYVVSEIVLPRRVHIIGISGESRLVFGGGAFMLRAQDAEKLRLESLVLDGQGRLLDKDIFGLLHAENVDDLLVSDCMVLDSAGAGLAVLGAAGRIAATRISGAREAGIRLIGSRGMSVTENVVEDCGDGGILVHRWEKGEDGTIVRGNRVSRIDALSGGTGQFGNAINVAKANGVIVADNRIDDCAFSAVRAFSSDNLQMTGNIATRLGETALYVEFASQGAVVANNIVDEAAIGISFANFMEHQGRLGVCSGNLVRNILPRSRFPTASDGYGVGIAVEADAAVTGNTVENVPNAGIQLGWGPYLRDVTATGNVVRDAGIGIAVSVVEGAGAALVADNLISGARKGGVLGMRWRDIATGDLADAEESGFPHLTVARNRVT